MTNVYTCVVCNTEIKVNRTPYFYQSKTLCAKCYYGTMCVYCNPHVPLAECNGHDISKNPINRFMKDKEFTDGIKFEYESERHLQPGARPTHAPSKRR